MTTQTKDQFKSDPWGAILPADDARESWFRLGTRLANAMSARLVAWGPDFVFQADGWTNTWRISTGAACALSGYLPAENIDE